ncbi:LysR family transcriptional regulator [Methanobrevibacter filiformis]|uniref:DNA-binding transcriptional regulator IlvY n=1 Tax=Methanobrevibacter filiformis TaxID=55758 RepID=A0A162FIU7_9EURY|nr:LysR family transcriptional regulator [Methanobrevibacter filiformis]KZX10640.1 DNA-binding transcriptional regulator IlvY [Methanobrevibacter filiformis]
MKYETEINIKINDKTYKHNLFQSLKVLSTNYSQRKTAEILNISHSVLNRRIKKAEDSLGYKLVKSTNHSSELTNEAKKLLQIYEKYENRSLESKNIIICGGHIASGLLEHLSSDSLWDISIYSSDDLSSYDLAKRNLVDILALDDPLLAFKNNLDFTPIAYDHLVLVSSKINSNINSLNDLNNCDFISVRGTAQRLAWQTLNDNNIKFNIKKEVKSQYEAFKIIRNSKNLYTFLNASFFKGNPILKKETMHVISITTFNNDKTGISEFINDIIENKSKEIAKQGFIPVN